jgi:cell division protein ZapE
VGPVGTGKTHLIAAMYHALHPDVPCAFLHSSTLFRTTVPPVRYAEALADRCDVLCLDEVEIDDPANEARLVLVLRALEQRGVKLLATSNVKPEQFMANRMGSGRFERFLQKEFAERYRLVFVGGEDHRVRQPRDDHARGRGWIGPLERSTAALRRTYRAADGERLWLSFDDLREASRTTAHARLLDRFAQYDHLFVADIDIANTDDALRLLRVVDDLYVRPDAPRLYFSAPTPPPQWFRAADQGAGVAADVAEKFTRTASRLHALCDIETLAASDVSVPDADD